MRNDLLMLYFEISSLLDIKAEGGNYLGKTKIIFFPEFFSIKCKLHCLELVHCKIYFSFAKINILKLFKIAANQTGLNRGLSSNFWWLRSANHLKFTEECVMCMEKHVFVKKIFTNELNMNFATMCLNWKDSQWKEWKHTLKKKFRVQ